MLTSLPSFPPVLLGLQEKISGEFSVDSLLDAVDIALGREDISLGDLVDLEDSDGSSDNDDNSSEEEEEVLETDDPREGPAPNAKFVKWLDSEPARRLYLVMKREPRKARSAACELWHMFHPEEVPPSWYLLSQCAHVWFHTIDKDGMERIPDDRFPAELRGKVSVAYNDVGTVLGRILTDRDRTDWRWEFTRHEFDTPLHCSSSGRWRDCEDFLNAECGRSDFNKLMVALFIDDYVRKHFRAGKDTGVRSAFSMLL